MDRRDRLIKTDLLYIKHIREPDAEVSRYAHQSRHTKIFPLLHSPKENLEYLNSPAKFIYRRILHVSSAFDL